MKQEVSTEARLRSIPFMLRSELVEAAWNHGYRSERGAADGWLFFASAESVPGEVALATSGKNWFLAIDHSGVAAELNGQRVEPAPWPGRAAFSYCDQTALRGALSRAFQLASSLPTLPLQRFEQEVAGLGDTEIERIVRERVGQDIFRAALMAYWNGTCPITGITDPELLRASHIVRWADCQSDAERLDVHNGLLLSALWDAAFDQGLVSFDDEGAVLVSPRLSAAAAARLDVAAAPRLTQLPQRQEKMGWHRSYIFQSI